MHTELQRLKEIEAKGVTCLVKRKEDAKAYAQANGGRVLKDDGMGLEIRKKLTTVRAKLIIVRKKIKKFGEMGKIPMGASMRTYNEDSDSSVDSSSAEEMSEGLMSNASSESGKPGKKKKVKKELLKTELVY